MKVAFCIPALEGGVKTKCHQSLVLAYRALDEAKIPYEELFVENCPYLSTARATLEAMFMQDKENTDAFFIDSDVAFHPTAVLKILARPERIVAGIYPLKRDFPHGYPAVPKTNAEGRPIGRDGLIEADFVPTGFLRIKRDVFENLRDSYPELKYEDSVVEVLGADVKEAYDLFGMGIYGTRFTTEDYAFCKRWRDIGGQIWIYPDIDFHHVGQKAYYGNYHKFLLRQPGGREDPNRAA